MCSHPSHPSRRTKVVLFSPASGTLLPHGWCPATPSMVSFHPCVLLSSGLTLTELMPQWACLLYFKRLTHGSLWGRFNASVINWKEANLWRGVSVVCHKPRQRAELAAHAALSLQPGEAFPPLDRKGRGQWGEFRDELEGRTAGI